MGREQIPISYVTDITKRKAMFNKRSTGLIKKAAELSVLCGCEISLMILQQEPTNYREYQTSNSSLQSLLDAREPYTGEAYTSDFLGWTCPHCGSKNLKTPTKCDFCGKDNGEYEKNYTFASTKNGLCIRKRPDRVVRAPAAEQPRPKNSGNKRSLTGIIDAPAPPTNKRNKTPGGSMAPPPVLEGSVSSSDSESSGPRASHFECVKKPPIPRKAVRHNPREVQNKFHLKFLPPGNQSQVFTAEHIPYVSPPCDPNGGPIGAHNSLKFDGMNTDDLLFSKFSDNSSSGLTSLVIASELSPPCVSSSSLSDATTELDESSSPINPPPGPPPTSLSKPFPDPPTEPFRGESFSSSSSQGQESLSTLDIQPQQPVSNYKYMSSELMDASKSKMSSHKRGIKREDDVMDLEE